jgi:hypothetical protein
LLLGIQGPHHDYETVISNGMKYSQKLILLILDLPSTTTFQTVRKP